jgi:hypothetical protein
VLSIINSSVTEDVLATTVAASTTHATWVTPERMFASTSREQVMQIRMELTTIQKKVLSITNHFRKVKRLSDTLAAIGKRLDDQKLIAYMLQGLGSEYESLVTSIMTHNDIYTISDVYAHMLSSEMCHTRNGMMFQASSANNVNKVSSDRGNGRGG